MGHPTDIFVPAPPAGCICAICHDVLEDASAVKECGHTFCAPCIEASLDTSASCPNCRVDVTPYAYNPNYTVREIVDALHVRCPEWKGGDGEESNAKKRKRDGDDSNDAACSSGCNWKGPLKDLENHGDVCQYKTVTCSVEGCDHTCHRKDMEGHLSGAGLLMHLDLMKKSIVAGYEERIATMEAKIEEKYNKKIHDVEDSLVESLNHMRYANDCRSWIENKPDALFDTSIYQLRQLTYGPIVGLLCVIPGPTGSVWEGARIPMSLRYSIPINRDEWRRNSGTGSWMPPRCRFPGGFFHPNIYPSGTVCVSVLMQEDGWTSETTLPEILFSVQQMLSHPNFLSPAQIEAYKVWANDGPEKYQARAKEEAEKYANPDFTTVAGGDDEIIDTVEICDKAEALAGKQKKQDPPKPPPFQRDANGKLTKLPAQKEHEDCECSCCAWGQLFWDDKAKMRFLFGV